MCLIYANKALLVFDLKIPWQTSVIFGISAAPSVSSELSNSACLDRTRCPPSPAMYSFHTSLKSQKERKTRGIKWQINLLTKHLPLGSHLSVCRRPGCLLCHPRDGLTRTEWDAARGPKLSAMVIHHEEVKTSTSVPSRRHPVMEKASPSCLLYFP